MKQIFTGLMSLIIGNTTIMSLTNILNQQQNLEQVERKLKIEKNIKYSWESKYQTWTSDSSNTYELLNWRSASGLEYFEHFADLYDKFEIDGSMQCTSFGVGEYVSRSFSGLTSFIYSNSRNPIQFTCDFFQSATTYVSIVLKLWVSGDSIFWRWFAYFKGSPTAYIKIVLNSVTFFF